MQHGNIGLGTFEDVNGEMILLDGQCFRASENGTVVRAEPDRGVPFAVATFFHHGDRIPAENVENIEALKRLLDLKIEQDFGLNSMHIVRIDGTFAKICARSESAHRSHHVSLKEILQKTQKDFVFSDIIGTLVCVYFPDYMDGINAPGWHLHFISEDSAKTGVTLPSARRKSATLPEKICHLAATPATSE